MSNSTNADATRTWAFRSRLNPDAEPWSPATDSGLNPFAEPWDGVPMHAKSIYITFSYGRPLTKAEITDYFAERFGRQNVVNVYVNEPANGKPLFGKVVFSCTMFPHFVLKGEPQAEIFIKGKSLYCKPFLPRGQQRI